MGSKVIIAVLSLLITSNVIASGGDILGLLWLQLLLFIIISVMTIRSSLNFIQKIALFVIYVISVYVSFIYVENLSYREYKIFINLISFGIPILNVSLLKYHFIKKNNK